LKFQDEKAKRVFVESENIRLKKSLKELQDEFKNIRKNIEINRDNFTPNQLDDASKELTELRNQIENIKLELAKKEGNLKYVGEIIKQSRKTMALLLSSILAGSGVGVGVGVSKFSLKERNKYKISDYLLKKIENGEVDDDEVSKIRNRFIEANKEKLDSLTNENVRNNKENLKLLKQSLALGYLPKNIQIQNKIYK